MPGHYAGALAFEDCGCATAAVLTFLNFRRERDRERERDCDRAMAEIVAKKIFKCVRNSRISYNFEQVLRRRAYWGAWSGR